MKKAILMGMLAIATALGANAQKSFVDVTNNSPYTLGYRAYGAFDPVCTPSSRTITYAATSPSTVLYASSATWVGAPSPTPQYFNRIRFLVPGSTPLQYVDLSLCSGVGPYDLELSNGGPHIRVDIGENVDGYTVVINNNE